MASLTVTTSPVVSITANSAQSGGNITSDGGFPVTVRGLCWNTSGEPTTADNKTDDGSGTGEFTGIITGLQPDTTYYVRAYATNNNETVYGNSVEFKTAELTSSQFIDLRDGNIYNFVLIGDQTWMAENLRYLPEVVGPGTGSETTPYYYVYGYDGTNVTDAKATANYNTYGVLYNWPAAMAGSASSTANPSGIQGVCPAGWHMPSDEEWKQMEMFLGMSQEQADGTDWRGTDEGGKLKEGGTTHWVNPNEGSTNASEFTALPAGCRDGYGSFSNIGYYNFIWTATENTASVAWSRYLYYFSGSVVRTGYSKENGFSVRCIKDPVSSIITTSPVTSITANSAQSGGNITSDGGSPITVRGICWNSSGAPTTADNKTEEGSGTGEFAGTMTGLQPNTTYYVRAYASSDLGTSYGETVSFTTLSEGGGSGILLEDNFDVYPSEQNWYFDLGDGLFTHQDSKAILSTNYNRYTVKFYSKLQRSVNEGTLTFVTNMLTYEDNNTAYGPLSRGLVSGKDRNNAIEFINITGSIIQARTVSNGVATTTDYNVGASVCNYYDYKIVASNTKVDFYFNNNLIATHTTNIPLVPLNVYFDTSSWAGNVPIYINYVRLELDPY